MISSPKSLKFLRITKYGAFKETIKQFDRYSTHSLDQILTFCKEYRHNLCE